MLDSCVVDIDIKVIIALISIVGILITAILSTLALTRLVVIRKNVLSRFSSHSAKAEYSCIVRLAALFRVLGSSGDTHGSLLSR